MEKIVGKILGADYVPGARCIVLKMMDLGGKPFKPIALYEESFKFKPGQNVDMELEKTTELFRKYKFPITIEYDESKQK